LLLSMVTPLGWLERVPTYKEALDNIKDKDLHTYGFLGYPVLQCGDIVMYSNPGAKLFVPVGEDQVSHVETSREIVRKFNLHNLSLDAEALLAHPDAAAAYLVIRGSFDPTMSSFRHHGKPTLDDVYDLERVIKARVGQIGLDNYLVHLDS